VPWDIIIKRADGFPLGTQQEVQQEIARAFPGVRFYRDPSGSEKLASLPPGVEMPEVIKRHWETAPAELRGDLSGRRYSLRFYLGAQDTQALPTVTIEARGKSRAAVPMMEALTLSTGWIIVDDWGNTIVENGRAISGAK
jgi:hypothetical protein